VSHIVAGLVYLRWMSFRNALISRVQRLRQPKYLFGGIAGLAYLYFVFFRRVRGGGRGAVVDMVPADQIPTAVTLAALLLLILVVLIWVWTRERAALAFSEAEISFLFPAPITRKTLIHYRLIDSQLRLIITSLILALLSSGWNALHGNALIRIVGWWLVFTTMTLHITGSAFTITKWLDRGVTSPRRQMIVTGTVVLLVAIIAVWGWPRWHLPGSSESVDFSALSHYFTDMIDAGPIAIILLPLKWIVRPLFAADFASFVLALGPALLVFAAHYVWVLRSESSFEEASIARAQKLAARVAAIRAGNLRLGKREAKARRPPFNIASTARVEFAFLWKNVLSSAEYLRPRTALIAAAVIIFGASWLKKSGNDFIGAIIGPLSLGIAVYALIFGPMVARQDLRSDLLNADILKTYPLRGWQIVLGEMLTPLTILTVLLWLLLLSAALMFPTGRIRWLTDDVRTWGAICVAIFIPFLCSIQLLVLNAGALFFPAWTQIGPTRGAGIDVMGQRLLFLAGLLLAIVGAMLPTVIVGGIFYFLAQFFLSKLIAFGIAFLAMIGVLIIEVGVGIEVLGRQFERFDLSSELRP